MTSTYQAMKAYRDAFVLWSDLRKKHDALVEQQKVLLPDINKAEATANKAREAMLQLMQQNPVTK